MGGEIFGFLMEKLLESGALDVWYTPIYMKKNRPAVKLSVLCLPEDEPRLTKVILSETTTLGVRSYTAERSIMERDKVIVVTPYGEVSFKRAAGYDTQKAAPEYEDLKKLAKENNIPLRKVYEEAIKAYLNFYGEE